MGPIGALEEEVEGVPRPPVESIDLRMEEASSSSLWVAFEKDQE